MRNADEFLSERLAGAECVPLDRLASEAMKWDRDERLILMCKMGVRSGQGAEKLRALGFSNVVTLEGGIEACKKAGLDVIVQRKRLPIIRQVMIGAGLMALLGLGLSQVHPWLIAITWLVGCGLVFAGLTGYCPMAKVLERMPWNTVGPCGGKSCG